MHEVFEVSKDLSVMNWAVSLHCQIENPYLLITTVAYKYFINQEINTIIIISNVEKLR